MNAHRHMNAEIGNDTPIFLFWEYLFWNFGILSVQCRWSFDCSVITREDDFLYVSNCAKNWSGKGCQWCSGLFIIRILFLSIGREELTLCAVEIAPRTFYVRRWQLRSYVIAHNCTNYALWNFNWISQERCRAVFAIYISPILHQLIV